MVANVIKVKFKLLLQEKQLHQVQQNFSLHSTLLLNKLDKLEAHLIAVGELLIEVLLQCVFRLWMLGEHEFLQKREASKWEMRGSQLKSCSQLKSLQAMEEGCFQKYGFKAFLCDQMHLDWELNIWMLKSWGIDSVRFSRPRFEMLICFGSSLDL